MGMESFFFFLLIYWLFTFETALQLNMYNMVL